LSKTAVPPEPSCGEGSKQTAFSSQLAESSQALIAAGGGPYQSLIFVNRFRAFRSRGFSIKLTGGNHLHEASP